MIALITAHTRALIVAAIRERKEWRGARKGVHVRMADSVQPDLEGNRIAYEVRRGKRAFSGTAGTVFDACAEIDAILRRKA